jgi:hypothetical protein
MAVARITLAAFTPVADALPFSKAPIRFREWRSPAKLSRAVTFTRPLPEIS